MGATAPWKRRWRWQRARKEKGRWRPPPQPPRAARRNGCTGDRERLGLDGRPSVLVCLETDSTKGGPTMPAPTGTGILLFLSTQTAEHVRGAPRVTVPPHCLLPTPARNGDGGHGERSAVPGRSPRARVTASDTVHVAPGDGGATESPEASGAEGHPGPATTDPAAAAVEPGAAETEAIPPLDTRTPPVNPAAAAASMAESGPLAAAARAPEAAPAAEGGRWLSWILSMPSFHFVPNTRHGHFFASVSARQPLSPPFPPNHSRPRRRRRRPTLTARAAPPPGIRSRPLPLRRRATARIRIRKCATPGHPGRPMDTLDRVDPPTPWTPSPGASESNFRVTTECWALPPLLCSLLDSISFFPIACVFFARVPPVSFGKPNVYTHVWLVPAPDRSVQVLFFQHL